MHFAYSLGAVLAGSAAAAPSASHFNKRSFTVDRVAVGTVQRNIITDMQQAFNKFQMDMPAALADADAALWNLCHSNGPAPTTSAPANPAPTGSNAQAATIPSGSAVPKPNPNAKVGNATATPHGNDVQYNAAVTIGGQTLMMDFDTGSSDLWVFSTKQPVAQQQNHQVFDPTKSQTFKQVPGAQWSIHYGDGSSSSGNVVGTDTVEIGGVSATGQTVELATDAAQQFLSNNASSGLVGLAFSKLNTVKPNKATTFLDTIQHQLAEPIMAANLKHNTPGSYAFGQIDPTAFHGELANFPVDTSKGFWEFPSTSFAIGNGPRQENPNAAPAIADTGTTLLMVDDQVAEAYWQAVPGAQAQSEGHYIYPCSAQLPDLQLAAGSNYMLTIPGALMNFGPVNANGGSGNDADYVPASRRRAARRNSSAKSRRDLIIELSPDASNAASTASSGGMCAGAMAGNGGSSQQIFGDIMFKAQYVVFNQGNASLSMAPHA